MKTAIKKACFAGVMCLLLSAVPTAVVVFKGKASKASDERTVDGSGAKTSERGVPATGVGSPETAVASKTHEGAKQAPAKDAKVGKGALSATKWTQGTESFFDERLNREVAIAKGEVLVRFKQGLSDADTEALLQELGATVIQRKQALGVCRLKIPPNQSVASFVQQHGTNANLQLVEPNFIASVLAKPPVTPNDPSYSSQWALTSIHAAAAWNVTTGVAAIVVAILDTGIELTHPDLTSKVTAGYDFVNGDADPADDHGHGTHVAGIVSAATDNGAGIAGVSWGSRLMPVKVINASGEGSYSDVLDGVIFAADSGARVLNFSIGGYAYSQILADAIEYAHSKGAVLLAAAGNDGSSDPIYPAALPEVIAVSATDSADRIWPSSNHARHIKLSAPGVDVISTGRGSSYTQATGTSASSAHAAGVAALICSQDPGLSNTQVEQILCLTADDLGEKGLDPVFGFGRLNAAKAVEQGTIKVHDIAITAVRVEPKTCSAGTPVSILVTMENQGTAPERNLVVKLTADGVQVGKTMMVGEIPSGDRRDLAFVWISAVTTNMQFTLSGSVEPVSGEADVQDNTRVVLYNQILGQDGVLTLYANAPPVHGWIAFQAYRSLADVSSLKSELSGYLNTSQGSRYYAGDFNPSTDAPTWGDSDDGVANSNTAILEGAWEEDEPSPGRDSIDHFWLPDNGYDFGFRNPILGDGVSAVSLAQTYFETAIASYPANRAIAYYWLGRVVHLLSDMAVPAHVHNDCHAVILGCGDEDYEKWTADAEHYKSYASSGVATDYSSLDMRASYNNSWSLYSNDSRSTYLFKLFLDMAEFSDQFESDGVAGESPLHGYCHNGDISCDLTDAECENHADELLPQAMKQVAGLYQLFWDATRFEPNDHSAQAQVLAAVLSQRHGIVPKDDVDWLKFTLANTSEFTLSVNGPNTDGRIRVQLYNSSLNQLYDQSSSGTLAWVSIIGTQPAGTYYVRISEQTGSHEVSPYNVSLSVGIMPPPASPTIASVSPSTLSGLPLPQTQLIRIYGSGFTSISTLLFNESIPSDAERLSLISANEIHYYIRTDTTAANWTVKVLNGAQESNLGYFTVVAPTPNTGSLTVNLAPSGAVSAGAQWQVDGASYRNSGDTATGLTPGSHTVSFKAVSGYTTPASHSVSVSSGATTTDTGTYAVITPSTYTLTLNTSNPDAGGATPAPLTSGNIYAADAVVQLTAYANYGYHFVGWSGALSGTVNPATITMSGNKSVTANFASGDDRLGTMTLTIQPPAAAAAGVQWGWNAEDYRNSGTSVTSSPGTYIFTIHGVDGWLGPHQKVVTLIAGQTTNVTVTFTQDTTPGLLTVTLSPPDAVTLGAKWRVSGGAAQASGATVSLLPGTNYAVTFDAVSGWTAPASRTVTVQRSQTAVVNGNYTPPAGQPAIGAIHPGFGALAGGAALIIEGVNFTAPASVLIGGKPATNVVVLGGSQIACLTPSNSVYGTVPVVVQVAGGNATNANGFSYGAERGSGIELVSAVGGAANAAAVQGNYAYIGEGSSFVVADVSNPASPSPIGRLAMPGMVEDITLSGNYAFVANSDAGLQVVDFSTPSVPKLVGFYDTPGISAGVEISGANAFVADGDGGLLILDISTPKSPILLSATSLGGSAQDIAVNGGFAYVVFPGALVIVDVTNPSTPIVRGQVTLPDSVSRSLAVSGTRVFVANFGGGLRIIDVSNPDAPTDLGRAPSVVYPLSVAVSGNLVLAGSAFNSIAVSSYSGGTMTFLGATYGVGSGNYKLAVAGSRAYVPGGSKGFSIVDVSIPSSPSLSGSFSGRSGVYGSVSLSANYAYACVDGVVSGLKIFDVANPALPIQVGQYDGGGGSDGQVLVTNGVAYLIGFGTEIRTLNVADPASPSLLHTIPITTIRATKMALAGNILFVAGDDTSDIGKFIAFDVSTPSSPIQRGQVSFTSDNQLAVSVAVNGNKAVVGLNSYELKVLDVGDVNAPVVRGSLTNIGYPGDIAMSADGHFAFIADANGNSLRVVDVGTSTSPVEVASIPLASRPVAISVRGNFVYVAGFVGVLIFDVSVPASPVLTRSYAAPSRGGSQGYGISVVRDVVHSRDTIYVGDYEAGLIVLQTKDTDAPSVQITSPAVAGVYTNATGTVNIGGIASDNQTVARVVWSNGQGGGGTASGTTNWSVSGIALSLGTNLLTATAFDQAGNSSNAVLTVLYQPTNQAQTISFADISPHVFGDPPVTLVAAASSGLPVAFGVVSGPATLSNSNVLTLTGAGTVTVRASQTGNGSFNAAPPVNVSFDVAKADQAVTFPVLTDKSAGDPPFTLAASASSGLAVYYDVVSGPATVSGNQVTLLGGGVATLVAWQPGNSNFNAATAVQRSFNVSKIPQSISFGPLSQQRAGDAPFALGASASSGLPVAFALVSGPATLSGNVVTLTGWGTVNVRASQAGNGTYAAAGDVVQSFFTAPDGSVLAGGQRLGNGAFQMTFYGAIGSNYQLQASTALTNWVPLFTFPCTNTPTTVLDITATNYSRRFYRTVGQ